MNKQHVNFMSGRNKTHKIVLKFSVKRLFARADPFGLLPVENKYGFTIYSIL